MSLTKAPTDFLLREHDEPKELFDFLVTNRLLDLIGGIGSADDTVLEKLYSNPAKIELRGYY